ncbi:aminotransferase class I/II-fold pyridoxal phosphate-dependent enzyme [Zooshikella harenae]|uniref:Aminotransferase class I/II-fold pyridoxal phosphate-dependent enzyme n=1 Tax=Zooshikella harenae TaxID=2827238 RepID=A0ABS5Z6G0_9GAMM|nr:aminotransferase class I/II-fold pyridoxal phosphate-dependent enzyme [Zooshikella harenae]MBU2709639.1 aminotransferase class I/II-fold pyridoxal phosphate-dependent enzyme [Zooshikella harenae]
MSLLTDELLPPADIPEFSSYMRSHIRGAELHLYNESAELRKCSPEQMLYHNYIQAGSPHGPALYAVKGEHWNGICPAFLDFINNFKLKREYMGYAECGYGIQRHRSFLRHLIINEHQLQQQNTTHRLDIDVGCLAMTTRMAMYDLAKVAYKYSREHFPNHTPVAVVPTPAWDYRGIFKELGYKIVYLPIRPENSWQPNIVEWSAIINEIKQDPQQHIALAVSNPQHNPTGMQWPIEVTEYLLELCASEKSYLLIDDAYYNVHDPRIPITNTLKAILNLFNKNNGINHLTQSGMFNRWVATRPFGKQFSCNTMGVAAITTSPILLRQLARESWINRYHCNTHNAEIMCSWLAQPESADWTVETGLMYTRQKERVKEKLVNQMGWPKTSVCIGPSTSYMLFEVPQIYQNTTSGIDKFRDDLFYATGTMICASLFNQAAPAPFVRLHLGSHPDIIDEILRRWQMAGLNYHQPSQFSSDELLYSPLPKQTFRETICPDPTY